MDNRSWIPDERMPRIESPLLIDIMGEATRTGWAEGLVVVLESRFGELPCNTMSDLLRVPSGEGGRRLTRQAATCLNLESFFHALQQELFVQDPLPHEAE